MLQDCTRRQYLEYTKLRKTFYDKLFYEESFDGHEREREFLTFFKTMPEDVLSTVQYAQYVTNNSSPQPNGESNTTQYGEFVNGKCLNGFISNHHCESYIDAVIDAYVKDFRENIVKSSNHSVAVSYTHLTLPTIYSV